jgi:hypothetical protein
MAWSLDDSRELARLLGMLGEALAQQAVQPSAHSVPAKLRWAVSVRCWAWPALESRRTCGSGTACG